MTKMTKLRKWEKAPKYVGNYSTGELLIHLGMDIKKYENLDLLCLPDRFVDFIEMTNDFQKDKISIKEYNEWIVKTIKWYKNK